MGCRDRTLIKADRRRFFLRFDPFLSARTRPFPPLLRSLYFQSSRVVGWAITLLLILLAGSGWGEMCNAQDGEGAWSEPLQLSTTTPSSWFADVAADSRGGVHVAWDSGIPPRQRYDQGQGMTLYAVRRDGEWSTPNDVALHLYSGVSRPALAVDGADRLHMLYRQQGVRYTQAAAQEAWSARAWSTSHRVSGLQTSYIPDLLVDRTGTIHAVWSEWVPVEQEASAMAAGSPYLADIFYRRSEDGGRTWSEIVNLSRTPDRGSARVHVTLDSRGGIHVSWDEGWDRTSMEGRPESGAYARSLDGGRTWTRPRLFHTPSGDNAQTTVATDDGEGVLLVWRSVSEPQLYFAWSTDRGGTWSAPQPLPGLYARTWISPFDAYDMVTDGEGRIHLIAVGAPERPGPRLPFLAVYHLVWDGEAWSDPEIIARYPGPENPEYPRAAIGGGTHLHVVWFVRPEGVSSTGVQVWYSERDLGLEGVSPLPTWTPTSVTSPSPTALPSPIPSPSPLPRVTSPFVPVGGLYSEADELRILGMALLPIAALVVVAGVWLRGRSR
jgi:hypothetical protein